MTKGRNYYLSNNFSIYFPSDNSGVVCFDREKFDTQFLSLPAEPFKVLLKEKLLPELQIRTLFGDKIAEDLIDKKILQS